ncbi:hypothetical protein LQV05_005612 [Cryptococcus neoformans]|nr:hypothetical protein LQV05_005612 [Cryptococcus neoformans]
MAPHATPTTKRTVVEAHKSGKSFSNLAKQYKRPKGTIKRWCREYAHREHTYPLPIPGRPKVLDQGQVRNLLRDFVRSPREPWSVHAKRYNVSVTTIVKIAHEHGFYRRKMRRKPYLSPKTVAKRKEWARNNMKRDWRDAVFTDECALELGGGSTRRPRTTRRAGEAYAPQHILPTFHSGRQSLMVWGAISYYQKFPLLRLPLAPSTVKNGVRSKAESLNGLRYTEMVIKGVFWGEGGILRSLRSSGFENIFVLEDGAPSHRAAVAKAARAEMGIETLDHPPSSPDLNVIENIWYLLKTKVAAFPRVATSLDELWEQIQKAWDEIDLEQVWDLIDEMEQSRVAVWKAQGKSTKY